MIESDVLGAAAGVQNQAGSNNLNSNVMPALVCSVVIGCFKRGRMDKAFKVTADTYKALLGDDPFNPSYTVIDDAFIAGASEIMIMRVGSLVSAAPPITPEVPSNKPASVIISGTICSGIIKLDSC
ncbi:hypothetical protein [Psychrobacter aquimaris]|uniref:hypothetical protein n=1 Tax=Psychrobacter aquimaris TaxID=292733 RepID=UPI0018DFB701|nr:hypothetical protein [Psychrobacter aquimaris]